MERIIVKDIKALIKSRGGFCFKEHADNCTEVGLPDLICCYKGLFIGIEVKDKGKLKNVSNAQLIKGRKIIESGGIWLSTDNVNDVKRILEVIDNGCN